MSTPTPFQSIYNRVAAATGGHQPGARPGLDPGGQLAQAAARIAAHPGRQLPAPQHQGLKAGHTDPVQDIVEISGPFLSGVSADLVGLVAAVRAQEGGKAGVNGPGGYPKRVGNLPVDFFGDRQPADTSATLQLAQHPLEAHVHRNGRDKPQIIVRFGFSDAGDALPHLGRHPQFSADLSYPRGIAVAYRQEGIGKTGFDPLDGKASKAAGAKHPYAPGRENVGEKMLGRIAVFCHLLFASPLSYSNQSNYYELDGIMSNIFEAFEKIAEQKIREAMENGEFDDLPGKGKPLELEEDRHLPVDIRLAHKILKNADCLPPELEIRKEILTIEEMLEGEKDAKAKYRQIKKLNYLVMKLNMSRHTSLSLEKNQVYYDKVLDRMGKKETPD
jgi:hypothetical protein